VHSSKQALRGFDVFT